MPAYVAMVRISGPQPRLHATSATMAPVPALPDADTSDRIVAVDLVGRSFDDRLAEWWNDLITNLRQTTFFLGDPESWR